MCWGSYRLSMFSSRSQEAMPCSVSDTVARLLVDDEVARLLGLDLRELALDDGGRPLELGDDPVDPEVEIGRLVGRARR